MRINALSLAVILATLAAAGPGLAAEKGPLSQVWGRIKVDVGMMKLPFGVPNDLAISLEAADGKGYKRQVVSDSNEMRNAVKSGKFVFRAVPTETPLKLTVSYTSPAGTTAPACSGGAAIAIDAPEFASTPDATATTNACTPK